MKMYKTIEIIIDDKPWQENNKKITFDDEGNPIKSGDKTIFSLLRDILSSNKLLHNRFLIDSDETNYVNVLPHKDNGYCKVYDI